MDDLQALHQAVMDAVAANDIPAAQAAFATFQQALREGYEKQNS